MKSSQLAELWKPKNGSLKLYCVDLVILTPRDWLEYKSC